MFLYQTAISAAFVLNYSLILSKRPLGFLSFTDFYEVEVSVVVHRTAESEVLRCIQVERLDSWGSSHDICLDVSSSPLTFPDVICTYAYVNTRLDGSKRHKTIIAGKTPQTQLIIPVSHIVSVLTPWSRVLLEKLTDFQLVKKFLAFYGTPRFITAFTSARHLSLSWASSIQSIPPHPNSWRSILILSSHVFSVQAKNTVELQRYSFLISALYTGKRSALRPRRFIPGIELLLLFV
jgi:hypothetical protein